MKNVFASLGKRAFLYGLASAMMLGPALSRDAMASVHEVSVSGKDAAAAEGNARLSALRQCINTMIAPGEARKRAMELRPVLRKAGSLTSLEVLGTEAAGKVTKLRARVEVDEAALRAELESVPSLKSIMAKPAPSAQAPAEKQLAKEGAAGIAERGGAEKAKPAAPHDKAGTLPMAEVRKAPAAASAMPDAKFLALVADRKTDPQAIMDALAAGADPNAAVPQDQILRGTEPDWPALMVYLGDNSGPEEKSSRVVKAFLDAGADANWAGSRGYLKSIVRSAMYRSFDGEEGQQIFKFILSAKPDLKRVDNHGDGILHHYLESSKKQPEIFAFIIASGADPNTVEQGKNERHRTPVLFDAIKTIGSRQPQPTEYLQIMLKAGADPNLTDGRGKSALHHALESKAFDAFEMLLKNGADPNRTNKKGETPLFAAVDDYADITFIKALLAHKADVNIAAKGRNNNTPLIEAARSWDEGCETLVDMLLAAGADPNARVANGRTALWFAAREKKAAVVQKLLEKGADPNICGKNDVSPLLYAIRSGNVEMVRQLAKHGADTKAKVKYKDGSMVSLKELMELQAEAWKISDEMKACIGELSE